MQPSSGEAPDAYPQLSVEVQSGPQEFCLILAGELDIASAPALDRLLDEVVSDGHPRMIIDLAGLTFMDSIGLSSMLRARAGAKANDHHLTVRGGSRQVKRLFEVTGMLELFTGDDVPGATN